MLEKSIIIFPTEVSNNYKYHLDRLRHCSNGKYIMTVGDISIGGDESGCFCENKFTYKFNSTAADLHNERKPNFFPHFFLLNRVTYSAALSLKKKVYGQILIAPPPSFLSCYSIAYGSHIWKGINCRGTLQCYAPSPMIYNLSIWTLAQSNLQIQEVDVNRSRLVTST